MNKYKPHLLDHYNNIIIKNLQKKLNYKNIMQVPKIYCIILNIGAGKILQQDSKKISSAINDLSLISGQKPIITKAKKSISSFKIRKGMPLGVKVTLRKYRMYDFLDRLINIALPRVRDFRGLNPNSFDGYGNYAMGIKEHIIFPEIDYDKVKQIWGMNIVICVTSSQDNESRELLREFNFPFLVSK